MDLKKMWSKIGKDAVKTGIAGGLAGVGITASTSAQLGPEQAVAALVTAFVSSAITGLFNYLKHK